MQLNTEDHSYWYIVSYPKSGNTWCRIFITELLRLTEDNLGEALNLNQDIETGAIASSRIWIDDQLGVNSCDLSFSELDPLRGRAGASAWLFAVGERFHKVHDAFQSPDSLGRPIVSTAGCAGVVYILRHPEDVAVSLSHFFSWPFERCVDFLLDSDASLRRGDHIGRSQVRQYMGRWDQHVCSWADQTQLPVLILRYEDMLAKGVETFTGLATFLGLPNDSKLIGQTLENTSIDRLKKLEEDADGFAEKPTGCERFFRSGRTGEGAEQLSIEQRMRLAKGLSETMKRFQYEGPELD